MEIVRYAIVDDGEEILGATYDSERDAITSLEYSKGCKIVKLVGTMPEKKKLRKCRHEIWIKPCKIDDGQNNLWDLLGITQYDTAKSECCTVRAIVTMEEVGGL